MDWQYGGEDLGWIKLSVVEFWLIVGMNSNKGCHRPIEVPHRLTGSLRRGPACQTLHTQSPFQSYWI